MGRRVRIFPLIGIALLFVCFGLSRVGVAHAARTMAFGGGTNQNLFQLQLQYCEDGIQIAVQQQSPISTDAADFGAANAHFSLQLTAATPAVNRVLPYPIVLGDGTTLINGFAMFPFTTLQAPGTLVQISVGRWEQSTSPSDSDPDNVQTDRGGAVEACTIFPTATPTVTTTLTPSTTPTTLPTSTTTPVPSSTATSISTSTAIPSPTTTRTELPAQAATATATPVSAGLTVAITQPRSPHLFAFQAAAKLNKGSGSGSLTETLKLFLPGGAVNTNLTLHLATPALSSLSAGLRAGSGQGSKEGFGFIFGLSARDASGKAVSQFSGTHPVLVQLLYDPSALQGIDPATLRISAVDSTGKTWQDLPTTVDTFHHVLTARAPRLTLFLARGITTVKGGITSTGPTHITMLAVSQASLSGIPLSIILPQGHPQAPVSLSVTGAPGAKVSVAFSLADATIIQTLTLDAQGYAATYFAPPTPLKSSRSLQMSVKVSTGGGSYTVTGTVTLAAGQATGPLPPGAPPLWATLSSSSVRAQAASPVLTVRTAPSRVVYAVLQKAGKPVAGFSGVTGTADRQGLLTLPLTFIHTLPAVQNLGKGKTLALEVVVTVNLHGSSSMQILALTVRP